MSRRRKIKPVKKTGHPYVDNALRNMGRRFNAEMYNPAIDPWFSFHVGLPRKQKKHMKKISMGMNFFRYITGLSKESK